MRRQDCAILESLITRGRSTAHHPTIHPGPAGVGQKVAKANMGKQGKRKAGLVTEASSRKARRKEQRQMKKQRRARAASFDSAVGRRRSESGDSWTQMSKQGGGGGKKSKSSTTSSNNRAKANAGVESSKPKKKRSSSVDKKSSDAGDPYAHLDPAVAAQLRADDAEIAEMERMLGVGGGGAKTAEERKRLNKEYEKLEGYGSDFGEFLYDLDGLPERLGGGEDGSDSDDNIHMNNDDNGEGDEYSEDSAASDVDMREQYESEEDKVVEKSAEKKKDKSSKKKDKKKKKKSKSKSASSDPYAHMDDETAAALRAEDAEIAALEDKLGIKAGKKDRKKLNKEYASEGYDESFGDWLYGLDDMAGRLANGKGGDYDDGEFSESDASSAKGGDDSSDEEGVLPMKDPAMSDEEEDFDDEFHARYAAASKGDNEEEQSLSASDSNSDSDGSTNDSESGNSSDSNSGSGNSDDSSDEEEGDEPDHDYKFTYRPSAGEDIYGNKRDDDNDSGQRPTKYVPPHLRKKMTQEQSEEGAPASTRTSNEGGGNNDSDREKKDEDDPDRQENLRSIKRSLNNVLNRLSDQMLESVSKSISGMYQSNPVNDVNECFLTNIKNACVPSNLVMSGLIPIYVACASGVHVQTGDDVQLGGYLLEHIVLDLLNELEEARNVQEDDSAIEYDDAAGDESVLSNKRPCNLVLILCYLYNYNIVHCALMYDLIRELIENFSEMDVEVLLLILSHCGYQLRSDDPTALKDIVLLVQDRAIRAMDDKEKGESVRSASSSRVQYMIGAMTDLKNNKRRKKDEAIGQKTASYRKIVGRIKSTSANSSFGRSSDASMRIKLQDIKDIETKGRWWKVGAKWRGNQFHDGSGSASGSHDLNSRSKNQSAMEKEEDALLVLASKYRMNTDLRRSIFCIIMGSTDCEDAFEKLVRAGMLKGKAERDVVRVLIECCSQEKSYNPYYAHLASRICEYQPSCNFTLRLTYWDAFKQFESMKPRKAANMAKLLAHLVCNGRGLNLNVLKVIEIDNDGMSEKAIIFLMVLFTTLFEAFDDPLQVTGLFEAAFASSKNKRKRSMGDEDDIPDDDNDGLKESLSLFLLQFLKKSPKNVKKSKFRTNFKAAVKACETDELDMMM